MDHYVFSRQTRERGRRTSVVQGMEEWDSTVGSVNTSSAAEGGGSGISSFISGFLLNGRPGRSINTLLARPESSLASHMAWDLGAADYSSFNQTLLLWTMSSPSNPMVGISKLLFAFRALALLSPSTCSTTLE